MASHSSSVNFYISDTTIFLHNCLEWSRQKLENLLHLLNTNLVRVAVVFLVVSTLLSCLLPFFLRCDERNLINHFKSMETYVEKDYTEIWTTWKTQLKEREKNYKSKKLEWVPRTQFQKDLIEPSADHRPPSSSIPLYIGRASYENGTIVGNYVDIYGGTYFAYDGKEFFRPDCEVLVYPKGTVSWILKGIGDTLPDKSILVYGGISPKTKETGYICRWKVDDHLHIGMTHSNVTRCSVGLHGVERTSEIFEVLVLNAMGRLLGIEI